MKKIFFLLFLVSIHYTSTAQPNSNSYTAHLNTLQDSLQSLSRIMINNPIEDQRYLANYSFIKTLVSALKTPHSFHFGFDSLKSISRLNAPDNRFRMFTWHIQNNNGTYRYYGAIQLNTADGKLQLLPLVDFSDNIKKPTDTITDHNKWYGAQYYKIIPVESSGTPYYILLGWKGSSAKTTKKVIDILHFKDNVAYFGLPVFEGNIDQANAKRVIFEYTRQASMFLNYDEAEKRIVFDHLSPPSPQLKGRFELYGPDMTYDSYRLVNGRLRFSENVVLRNKPSELDEQYLDPKKPAKKPARKIGM